MTTYHQEGQMQLPRADAIRSRLIDTFSLIEHLQGLSQAVPRHTIRELLELLESTNTKLWPLKLTLEVATLFILFIFFLEILRKWLSNFSLFWKSGWNVFDFVVTMLVRIEILRVPLVG
uniref:Ion transport domain-containing protein n=1 Tax=Macaca fascicularis TaxID=9541 RepID=A0A7N9D2Z7_MACFA